MIAPHFLTERYEELRASALLTGAAGAAPLGLALLQQAGLPAWLQAWKGIGHEGEGVGGAAAARGVAHLAAGSSPGLHHLGAV